jgi:hypothetical protein
VDGNAESPIWFKLHYLHCPFDRGSHARVMSVKSRAYANRPICYLRELHLLVPPRVVANMIHGDEIEDHPWRSVNDLRDGDLHDRTALWTDNQPRYPLALLVESAQGGDRGEVAADIRSAAISGGGPLVEPPQAVDHETS